MYKRRALGKKYNYNDYGTIPFQLMTSVRATLVQMETASTKERHSSADVSLVGKGRCATVSRSIYNSTLAPVLTATLEFFPKELIYNYWSHFVIFTVLFLSRLTLNSTSVSI